MQFNENDVELDTINANATHKAVIIRTQSKDHAEVKPFLVEKGSTDAARHEGEDIDYLFAQRRNPNPTTPMDTLTHLLKASLGTGILAMPRAFHCSGLIMGIVLTTIVAVVCTHCSYILVKCAHELYRRTGRHTMNYSEVAENAFKTGPQSVRKFSTFFKFLIPAGLFATYFLTCAAYTVIIAGNINEVLLRFDVKIDDDKITSLRILIACLLIPLLLMTWMPNLHYLAPVSMIANICMGTGLAITLYFFVTGENELQNENFKYVQHVSHWGEFFALTIFAMQAIGVMMPLENSMRKPQAMLGIRGVLSIGMAGVTVVYILLGLLGYIRYGPNVDTNITLNLGDSITAQIVKVAIAIAVYCTYGLQFFVCIEISKDIISKRFTKRIVLADYTSRTILTTLCVGLSALAPQIGPIMCLVGAFCFSLIGIMVPALLEIVTFMEKPKAFGRFNWMLYKNILLVLFSLVALVSGSKSAIEEIIVNFILVDKQTHA